MGGQGCHGWESSIEHEGTRTFFYMVDQYFGNDSLEPFECIFIALLALSNEGVPGHFFPFIDTHMKAPKRKNIALLAF